jgi:hypothetical protein
VPAAGLRSNKNGANEMGEAKRRGSRERRIEQARDRARITGLELANHPVDEEQFLRYSAVFSAASDMTLPAAGTEQHPVRIGSLSYALSDTPFNRGLMALYQQMRADGIDEKTRTAMGFRIASIRTVVRDPVCFERWVHEDPDNPAAVDIDDALLRACATAKYVIEDEDGLFDMADVARIASEIEAREVNGEPA